MPCRPKNLAQGHAANSRTGDEGAACSAPKSQPSDHPHGQADRQALDRQPGPLTRLARTGRFHRGGGRWDGPTSPMPTGKEGGLFPVWLQRPHCSAPQRGNRRAELRMHFGIGREEHLGKETHFRNKHTFVPAFLLFKCCRKKKNNNDVPN